MCNILDEGVREVLAIEMDTSLPAERVIRTLEQVVAWRGHPQALRLDNGPELIAERFMTWCAERGIALRYIQPGKPDQNAFIERFNRTYRTEVLNAYVFESLDQVREISAEWTCGVGKMLIVGFFTKNPNAVDPKTYKARLQRTGWGLIGVGFITLSASVDVSTHGFSIPMTEVSKALGSTFLGKALF